MNIIKLPCFTKFRQYLMHRKKEKKESNKMNKKLICNYQKDEDYLLFMTHFVKSN